MSWEGEGEGWGCVQRRGREGGGVKKGGGCGKSSTDGVLDVF